MAVGEPSVVEDLQQHVEDVRMRLLDLVQEDDRELLPAHRLRELPALVVADVSGRRPDEAGDGELLHVLRHVEAHHRVLVVEELLRERLRELRLADARRPEEKERAHRPVAVLDSGAGPEHRVRNRVDRLVLADHALVQHLAEAHQLLAFALHELRHRNAAPARDDLGDFVRGHDLAQERGIAALYRRFVLPEALLKRRDVAVLQLRRGVEIARVHGLLVADARLLEVCAHLAHLLDRRLLVLPLRGHRVHLLAKHLKLRLQFL